MKRSTERILTTHVGSLARADSLIPLLRLREQGQPYERLVREAVTDVVRQQVETGIDIVTDGEQSKSSFYVYVGCAPTEIIDLWDFKNIDQALSS